MTESLMMFLTGLLLAGLIALLAGRFLWRLSARKAEEKLLSSDENGYGPRGQERIAELEDDLKRKEAEFQSKKNDLQKRLNEEISERARAENEAAQRLSESDGVRQELATAVERHDHETARLNEEIAYWQTRSQASETRVAEAKLRASEVEAHLHVLHATLNDEEQIEDNSQLAGLAIGGNVSETAILSDEQRDSQDGEPQTSDETADNARKTTDNSVWNKFRKSGDDNASETPKSAAPRFMTSDRPAPEDLPELPSRVTPFTPARNEEPSSDDTEDENRPPKGIDMDELARRIRALESGV